MGVKKNSASKSKYFVLTQVGSDVLKGSHLNEKT